jgi:hypothetical protein
VPRPDSGGPGDVKQSATPELPSVEGAPGGSVGTSLLNTLAASAATAYTLANRATATSVATLQAQATVHGYQVVFTYAAGFWWPGPSSGLLLRSGALASLEITGLRDKPAPTGRNTTTNRPGGSLVQITNATN